VIRRSCSISVDFHYNNKDVERVLLNAAQKVDGVLSIPKPYVYITDFRDYAVEYTLYVYTMNVLPLQNIDAKLKRLVFEACKENEIDIRTPMLLKNVSEQRDTLPQYIDRLEDQTQRIT